MILVKNISKKEVVEINDNNDINLNQLIANEFQSIPEYIYIIKKKKKYILHFIDIFNEIKNYVENYEGEYPDNIFLEKIYKQKTLIDFIIKLKLSIIDIIKIFVSYIPVDKINDEIVLVITSYLQSIKEYMKEYNDEIETIENEKIIETIIKEKEEIKKKYNNLIKQNKIKNAKEYEIQDKISKTNINFSEIQSKAVVSVKIKKNKDEEFFTLYDIFDLIVLNNKSKYAKYKEFYKIKNNNLVEELLEYDENDENLIININVNEKENFDIIINKNFIMTIKIKGEFNKDLSEEYIFYILTNNDDGIIKNVYLSKQKKSDKKISSGYFIIPQKDYDKYLPIYNKYILSDIIMNNKIISQYLNINDSNYLDKKKFYIYYKDPNNPNNTITLVISKQKDLKFTIQSECRKSIYIFSIITSHKYINSNRTNRISIRTIT